MLRGLALAMLLVNLALLFWGSSRPLPERSAAEIRERSSTEMLPTLRLIDDVPSAQGREEAPSGSPCLMLGPLAADETDAAEEALAAWNLTWRRGPDDDAPNDDAIVLEITPGSASVWPESDIQALADSLASQILPCRHSDPIAPEAPKP